MPPGDNDQQLSSQDLQDLAEIRKQLPVGHPMAGKIGGLIQQHSQQPTQYETSMSTGKEGGAGAVWNDIKGAASSLLPSKSNWYGLASPGSPLSPIKNAMDTVSGYYDEKAEGRSPAYRAAAGAGRLTGIADPSGFEYAAKHGDPEGVMGHAVLPTVGALSPLLGEGFSALRGKVGAAIHTPEGELHPAVHAFAHPTELPEMLIDRVLAPEPKERVMARQGEANAANMESQMGEVEKARQKELGQWERLREQDAQSRMRRGREVDKQSSGIPNLNVMQLPEPMEPAPGEKPGSMYSVNRKDVLKPAAQRGKAGAGDVLRDLGQPILYTPREGVGYPGPRTAETAPVERPDGSTLERARARLKKSTEREPQE